jgi:ribA/ribD-fused uncharacterized protein
MASELITVSRDALLAVFRQVEALKRPCGMNPEEPQAMRNGEYASIALTLWRLIESAAPAEAQDGGSIVDSVSMAINQLRKECYEKGWNDALAASPQPPQGDVMIECHKSDTPERVCFYEQDFYVLSNFSAFTLEWKGLRFDTSEAAYHFEKFPNDRNIQTAIRSAPSAHEAFKIAERQKAWRRPDWEAIKVPVMLEILRAKVAQHEYVKRKLLATGTRELVEDSWRDDFWGWGPNRDGKNMLGKLWMQIRDELRQPAAPLPTESVQD